MSTSEILAALFDEDDPRALPALLRQLEAHFRDAHDGSSLQHVIHRLIGGASAACAPSLVWLARRFQAAPTAEGVAALSQALVATRAQLRAVGALPPDREGRLPAMEPAVRGLVSEQSSLVCVGLDSQWSSRVMHTMFFEQCLGADMSRSRSMGEDARDEDALVDVALGHLDADLQPVPGEQQRHVNAVLRNQYIRFPGPWQGGWDRRLLGSDLAEQLDARAFHGVVCIVTSLNPAALAHVRTLPGVDLALSRSTPLS